MSNIIDTIRLSGTDYTLSATTSGVSVIEVTQAQYDALPTSAKTDTSKMYVITDAEAGDLTNYYTKTETNSAITQATSGKVDTTTFNTYSGSVETALSGKQDTLVSGTNIKTINNTSILGSGNINIQGGGGKTVSGGTNISITTGETADTVSCTLPITASTSIRKNDITIGNDIVNGASDYRRLVIGNGNKYQYINARTSDSILIGTPSSVSSEYNVVNATSCIGIGGEGLEVGYDNISGYGSIAIGYGSKSIINKSLAIGYNTVASGTTQTNINNQLKIDTSNQIYIMDKDNANEICLQDYLGGGGSSINVVQTTGSSTTDVMSQAAVTSIIGDIETLLSNI